MPRRTPELRAQVTPMERFRINDALRFGPWRITDGHGNPGGPRRFDDDELEKHWRGWAKAEHPDWDEGRWAVRRFELGESAEVAFVECRRRPRST